METRAWVRAVVLFLLFSAGAAAQDAPPVGGDRCIPYEQVAEVLTDYDTALSNQTKIIIAQEAMIREKDASIARYQELAGQPSKVKWWKRSEFWVALATLGISIKGL